MNEPVVVDSDVVSFLFKNDTRSQLYTPILQSRTLLISFMTVAELMQWAAIRRWGANRIAELESHLLKFGVVHSDNEMCRCWAIVMAAARLAGKPISPSDACIAVTSLELDCPLVTNNAADYAGVPELKLLTATPDAKK